MKTRNVIILILSLTLLAACKPGGKLAEPQKNNKNRSGLSNQKRLENGALFIDACREKTLGNFAEAEKMFKKVVETDPKNDAAIYELGGIYEIQNNNDKALKEAKEAVRLEPGNKWYRIFLADMYQKTHFYIESAGIYKDLTIAYNDEDYYYNWAVALIYAAKYQEAIRVYDEMERKFGISEEIITRKEKLYLQLDKVDKAVEEVEKLIKQSPDNTRNYLLVAEIYMNNNMFEKATPYYKKVSEINPDDPYIHISLSDFYRKQGDKQKSFDELKLAFGNSDLNIDQKIKILLSYFTISEFYNEMKSQAYQLLNILTQTHPSDPKGFSMLGDFFYRDKKLKEAKEAFTKVISLDSSKYVVWETLLFIHSEENDNIALRDDSKRAMELFPVQPIPFLFNGMAKLMLKDYPGALRSLNSGLDFALDNQKLISQFYTYLGDTYFKTGKADSAFYCYDKVLEADPENAYVLNNYSYYLSLRSKNLEKALSMAKKANELEPNNDSYQDTYGWAFYKLGRYEDAKRWIEKALENGADKNGDVLEHYGDVLYKLGDIDKSLEFWQKAKNTGEALPNIEKKINDKKLYE